MSNTIDNSQSSIEQFWKTKDIKSPYLKNWFEQHCRHNDVTAESTPEDVENAYREWQELNSDGGECS